jgi:hypothetical protein
MVDAYSAAQAEVAQAFELLGAAKARLKAAFGEYADTVLPHRCSDYNLPETAKEADREIRRQAWTSILSKCQIQNLLSTERNRELESQIKNDQTPELTKEALMAFIESFASRMPNLLNETISEAFEQLRPRRSHLKTNSEYEVGKKVILFYIVEVGYSFMSTYAEQRLRSIDNAFHLLDGKGPTKYPGDLVTTIRAALNQKATKCETEYFSCEWYKNGNLHLTFKRIDLVRELNERAGASRLRKGEGER